jgi:DNA-binding transcriptional LysR family regulator
VQSEASTRTLAVVSLSITDLARPVGLIHRRQKPLTPTVSRFIQLLKDANEEPTRVAAAEAGGAVAGLPPKR